MWVYVDWRQYFSCTITLVHYSNICISSCLHSWWWLIYLYSLFNMYLCYFMYGFWLICVYSNVIFSWFALSPRICQNSCINGREWFDWTRNLIDAFQFNISLIFIKITYTNKHLPLLVIISYRYLFTLITIIHYLSRLPHSRYPYSLPRAVPVILNVIKPPQKLSITGPAHRPRSVSEGAFLREGASRRAGSWVGVRASGLVLVLGGVLCEGECVRPFFRIVSAVSS